MQLQRGLAYFKFSSVERFLVSLVLKFILMAFNNNQELPRQKDPAVVFGNTLVLLQRMERLFGREMKYNVVVLLICGSIKTIPLPKNQATLSETITAGQPIPTSSARWNKLTDGITYFIHATFRHN